jgi:predicted CXXCH cytochrome family protein
MNTKAILTAMICVAVLVLTVITTSTYAQTVDDCSACHQDTTLTETSPDGTVKSLYVDPAAFMKSVHAEAGFTCVDCHEDAQPSEHPAQGLAQVDCQSCHDDIAEIHAESTHGRLLKERKPDAPLCQDCHTTHAVMSSDNELSSVHPDNLRKTCGKCHANEAAPIICEAALEFAGGDTTALQRISLPSALAMLTTRLKGHGKTDFGCSYSTKNCTNCHTDVTQHSGSTQQAPVCSKCHDMKRSSLLFGKIHKPTIFTGPLMILLLIMYVLCIGGLILYFKKTASTPKKKAAEPSAE